ncbi:MAG: YebC/PmpR family DNA-binding transcriptional regulator, partial [Clostridia bacterium]|nr:YebC/PmpR family DNA-binding transcriptional regulator [Clostridia bacterium]
FLIAVDAGAEDVVENDDCFEIFTAPDVFEAVANALESAGVAIASKSVSLIPDMYVNLNEQQAQTFEKMFDMLDGLDDVQEIYHNVEE